MNWFIKINEIAQVYLTDISQLLAALRVMKHKIWLVCHGSNSFRATSMFAHQRLGQIITLFAHHAKRSLMSVMSPSSTVGFRPSPIVFGYTIAWRKHFRGS